MLRTLILSLVFITSLSQPQSVAAEPVRLRVLCYNIHHGEGVDGKLDLQRIANLILSVRPDLVALQEVDQKAKRSGNIDQPAELARLTKMHVAFGANIPLQGGHYGNAVLSRHPIRKHENRLLPNVDSGEQRGLLITQIEIPAIDESIGFLSTHFDHRRDHHERNQSASFIQSLFDQDQQATILAGDFNCMIGSEAMNRLDAAFQRTNEKPLPTIPVKDPTRQIDFILSRPKNRFHVIETRVLDESIASDHRAILSVLELLPDEASSKVIPDRSSDAR